ncbi:hypothetical protein BJ742DRAFT_536692 [Cladochytrium replicatum]|nr:hypothetical protein BJ742DRAFT_536692 [Cladochytrium replicatum]
MPATIIVFAALALGTAPAVLASDPTQLKLVNDFRAANRVGPLVEVAALDSCAQGHSNDMARMGKMTHAGSDGSNGNIRINRCTGATYTGENVADGAGHSIQDVMIAWEKSPDHRANLLNPNFNAVGFGVANNYWTQVSMITSLVALLQTPICVC